MIMGDGGILNKTKVAAEKYQNAQEQEEYMLGKVENEMNKHINASRSDFEAQTNGTATAEDIIKGKTAWVNGQKITGTLEYYFIIPFFQLSNTQVGSSNLGGSICLPDLTGYSSISIDSIVIDK